MTADLYLFRSAVRDLLAPKKLMVALALALVPAVLALAWRLSGSPGSFQPGVVYNVLADHLIFGFVLVLLAVVFGTGALSQDLEQKTIVYLLTRPIPRWRILGLKFLAAIIAVTVTGWLASLLLAVASFGPAGFLHSQLGRDCLILPVGAAAYGALFLLLATLLKRPLLFGLLFAFGWESWVPNLPGSFQKVSLMAYLRVLAPHPKPVTDVVDVSALLNAANPQTISHAMAWWVLGSVALVGFAGALLLFSTCEFVPRDDAE